MRIAFEILSWDIKTLQSGGRRRRGAYRWCTAGAASVRHVADDSVNWSSRSRSAARVLVVCRWRWDAAASKGMRRDGRKSSQRSPSLTGQLEHKLSAMCDNSTAFNYSRVRPARRTTSLDDSSFENKLVRDDWTARNNEWEQINWHSHSLWIR